MKHQQVKPKYQFSIFEITETRLSASKSEIPKGLWKQLMNSGKRHLTDQELSDIVNPYLKKDTKLRAQIFQHTIVPERLFELEEQYQLSGMRGPIQKQVQLFCQKYQIRVHEIPDWENEVIKKLLEKSGQLQNFQGKSSFATYLSTVIRSTCIDIHRFRSGRQSQAKEFLEHTKKSLEEGLTKGHGSDNSGEEDASPLDSAIAPTPTPEELLEVKLTLSNFEQAVKNSSVYQTMPWFGFFLKRLDDGCSIPQIAKEFNFPKSRLYTHFNALKAELVEQGWDIGLIEQIFEQ